MLFRSWSFEFEGQPYFEGFRELASNGLDKPVLNAFRMFGLLGNERVQASSSDALSLEALVSSGVREQSDIKAIAARRDREIEVMIWNYHDADVDVPPAAIELSVAGLPAVQHLALVEHFRIDRNHSNAFTAWKEMGSPQSPSPQEYERLEGAGQLQLLHSPRWVPMDHGEAHLQFTLPRHGVSLIRFTW